MSKIKYSLNKLKEEKQRYMEDLEKQINVLTVQLLSLGKIPRFLGKEIKAENLEKLRNYLTELETRMLNEKDTNG